MPLASIGIYVVVSKMEITIYVKHYSLAYMAILLYYNKQKASK